MATLVSKDTSGVYVTQGSEIELPDKRTRNFKKWSLPDTPDGRKRFRVGGQVGPIHYHLDPFSVVEGYKEIDLDVVLTPNENWDAACETNGYQVRLWQNRVINAKTIRYIAQFRRAGKWLSMAPIALLWRNDAGEKQLISKPLAVGLPVIDNKKYQVTWENAFGPGLDFRYNLRPDEFFKTIVIHNKSDLPAPTIGTAGLKLFLVMGLAWHPDSKASNDFASDVEADELEDVTDVDDFDEESDNPPLFSFKDELKRDTWWLRIPRAWDSFVEAGRLRPHTIAVDWKLRRKGNFVFALLSIPAVALNKLETVYPVFMDTDITEEQITASSDDAVNSGGTHPGDGNYSHTGWFVILGQGGQTTYYMGGWRFQTIPIAQGAEIDSASISVQSQVPTSVELDVSIAAEDVDDAATFASGTHEPYDAYLAKTSASYRWNVGTTAWGDSEWVGGSGQTSPNDVKTVVKEIVDRGGWESGNDIAFVSWNYDAGGTGQEWRETNSLDFAPAPAPAKFNCSYTAEAPSYIPRVMMVT